MILYGENMRNKLLFVAVILFTVSSFFAQTPPSDDLADYIKENYTKREVLIPVRDGVKLFTSIYEPKDRSQKYPILVEPDALYGSSLRRRINSKLRSGRSNCLPRKAIFLSIRTFAENLMSEGEFVDVAPGYCEYRQY